MLKHNIIQFYSKINKCTSTSNPLQSANGRSLRSSWRLHASNFIWHKVGYILRSDAHTGADAAAAAAAQSNRQAHLGWPLPSTAHVASYAHCTRAHTAVPVGRLELSVSSRRISLPFSIIRADLFESNWKYFKIFVNVWNNINKHFNILIYYQYQLHAVSRT